MRRPARRFCQPLSQASRTRELPPRARRQVRAAPLHAPARGKCREPPKGQRPAKRQQALKAMHCSGDHTPETRPFFRLPKSDKLDHHVAIYSLLDAKALGTKKIANELC